MKLEKLISVSGADKCWGGDCPTIYRTERDTLVVQGYRLTEPHNIDLPEGEDMVEIPSALIEELVRSGRIG